MEKYGMKKGLKFIIIIVLEYHLKVNIQMEKFKEKGKNIILMVN